MLLVFQCRLDSPASIVTTNYNMLYFKDLNRELNYRKAIQICMYDNIGNITMNKYLSRLQIGNLVGRNSAI